MAIDLILIGGGGHAMACLDVLSSQDSLRPVGIVERPEFRRREVMGIPVVGSDGDLPRLVDAGNAVLVAIGQILSPDPRIHLYSQVVALGASVPPVIARSANVAADTRIGAGAIIMQMAMVGPATTIGDNCIINSRTVVEHEVKIGDHCHLATGAIINGSCMIGDGTFIGSGAVLKQGIKVGERVVIGMGCIVERDVPSDTKMVLGRFRG
jgi:sugar O-acyltransferase (sialic acid O-acetyltransferase NeuD family)